MNQVVMDIWPILMTALMGVLGWQWKENQATKTRVAVLEKTIENLVDIVEHMQKRQDNHSKKQDEIVSLITDLKVEIVQQVGGMRTEISTISAEVKNINRALSVNDEGVKLKRNKV